MKMLLLSFLFLGVRGFICPDGWNNNQGTCMSGIFSPNNRNGAYQSCASYNAYIRDIPNGFANSDYQQAAGFANFVLLGMTCISSQTSACQWDSGRAVGYTNFYPNQPNITIGACVVMNVANGLWYSADCTQTNAYYGCESTPSITAPNCAPGSYYFRGYCYFSSATTNFNSASSYCSSNCGSLASIHSEGENSYVRDMGATASSSDVYILTGLQASGSSYVWNDRSSYDYSNFYNQIAQMGSCVSMAYKDDVVKAGQWIRTPCTASQGSLAVVCKKNLTNACDLPSTPMPTLAPPQCSSTYFVTGSGQLYSPGYPYGSQSNSCEYVISENEGSIASIQFIDTQLDSNSKIDLFYGVFDKVPFASMTNTSQSGQVFSSNSNTMKIQYTTAGSENFKNYWSADYYANSFTSTAANIPSTTSGCNGGYYDATYPNNITIYPYPCPYLFYLPGNGPVCITIWSTSTANYIYETVVSDSTAIAKPNNFVENLYSTTICTSLESELLIYNNASTTITVTYGGAKQTVPSAASETIVIPGNPNCFFEYWSGSGNFTSPNYPNEYNNNANCVYRFHSSRSRVRIFFDSFQTESCCDPIFINEQYETSNVFLAIGLSGSTLPKAGEAFVSYTNLLTLTFRTDASITLRGFSGHFDSI